MIITEFIPKIDHHGLNDGVIYNIEGEFDYGIGHFITEKVFYSDIEGDLVFLENDILTGFIYQNHEEITGQVMVKNNITQNDDYLLRRPCTYKTLEKPGLVLNGTSHPYPPNFY